MLSIFTQSGSLPMSQVAPGAAAMRASSVGPVGVPVLLTCVLPYLTGFKRMVRMYSNGGMRLVEVALQSQYQPALSIATL
jgi:hypothetical protein